MVTGGDIDPKDFGLPPRTLIEQVDKSTVALVINRKSRIIMADGRKLLEKAESIRQAMPGVSVVLKTTAPVCGKTKKFLAEEGLAILPAAQ